MGDAIAALLATPGVGWLAAGALLAGTVRGFAGFGTALIYLPFAGSVLPPFAAITTLIAMDVLAPLVAAPRAWPDAARRELAWLIAASAVFLPLGVLTLALVPPEVFRYAVAVIALVLLSALIGGLRLHRPPTPASLIAAGGTAGFFGGAAGLAGPPVILFYMASTRRPEVIRATILLFLVAEAAMALLAFWAMERLEPEALGLGAALMLPNALGIALGTAMFRPGAEILYRRVAYAVIAASALSGLPLWD